MRIGIFSDSYLPYTSGVVTSICTFRDELARLGHEIFIFAPSYPHYRVMEENVYRFFALPSPGNPNFTVAVPLSPRLGATAKKLDLDLVHVHSPFVMGHMGAKCARRNGLPLVFTYHTQYDQYVHYVPVGQEIARDFTVKYSRYFCNRCDMVITPSADIKNLIQSYGIQTPVKVIPTGVVLENFEKGNPRWLRENYSIADSTKICLFVGRLTKEKNIDFLIRAFSLAKKEMPDICLVIVATGPLEKELKKLVLTEGLVLNRDVIFTGFLPFERLVDAYNGADLFTFASVTETQGIVLVEAMASGLPVVAVRATGSSEMVEEGKQGLLTECSLKDFSSQLVQLLKDDEKRDVFSSQARRRAMELSSRSMARRLEAQYRSLVENQDFSQRKVLGSRVRWR